MSSTSRLYALYIDENIPQRTVRALRALGHDVLTLKEDGKAGKRYPDESVLRNAAALGRVVVTHNRKDFRRLHRGGGIRHRGMVLCTQDLDPKRLAANIHAALSNKETMDSVVVNVYRPAQE